jgi:hypothetical protein
MSRIVYRVKIGALQYEYDSTYSLVTTTTQPVSRADPSLRLQTDTVVLPCGIIVPIVPAPTTPVFSSLLASHDAHSHPDCTTNRRILQSSRRINDAKETDNKKSEKPCLSSLAIQMLDGILSLVSSSREQL